MARGAAGLDEAAAALREGLREAQDETQGVAVGVAGARARSPRGRRGSAALVAEHGHGDPRTVLVTKRAKELLAVAPGETNALAALALEPSDAAGARDAWDGYLAASPSGPWAAQREAHLAALGRAREAEEAMRAAVALVRQHARVLAAASPAPRAPGRVGHRPRSRRARAVGPPRARRADALADRQRRVRARAFVKLDAELRWRRRARCSRRPTSRAARTSACGSTSATCTTSSASCTGGNRTSAKGGRHCSRPAVDAAGAESWASEAFADLALAYAKLNRPREELATWRRYIPRIVDDRARVGAMMNMGEAEMRLGHVDDALGTFREVLRLCGDLPNSGNVGSTYVLTLWDVAVALDRSGDPGEAIDNAAKASRMMVIDSGSRPRERPRAPRPRSVRVLRALVGARLVPRPRTRRPGRDAKDAREAARRLGQGGRALGQVRHAVVGARQPGRVPRHRARAAARRLDARQAAAGEAAAKLPKSPPHPGVAAMRAGEGRDAARAPTGGAGALDGVRARCDVERRARGRPGGLRAPLPRAADQRARGPGRRVHGLRQREGHPRQARQSARPPRPVPLARRRRRPGASREAPSAGSTGSSAATTSPGCSPGRARSSARTARSAPASPRARRARPGGADCARPSPSCATPSATPVSLRREGRTPRPRAPPARSPGPSGSKRLLLYLRWMVRRADGVDLGLWDVDPARLLVPVDVHIHRLGP